MSLMLLLTDLDYTVVRLLGTDATPRLCVFGLFASVPMHLIFLNWLQRMVRSKLEKLTHSHSASSGDEVCFAAKS